MLKEGKEALFKVLTHSLSLSSPEEELEALEWLRSLLLDLPLPLLLPLFLLLFLLPELLEPEFPLALDDAPGWLLPAPLGGSPRWFKAI